MHLLIPSLGSSELSYILRKFATRSEPAQKGYHLSRDGTGEKRLQRTYMFSLFLFLILMEIIVQKQMQI